MPKLIWDCDVLLYRAASACEHKITWENSYTIYSDLEECKGKFKSLLKEIKRNLGKHKSIRGFKSIFCVSDKKNFRKLLLPTYKANRNPTEPLVASEYHGMYYVSYKNPQARLRKPAAYYGLLKWVRENYHVEQREYLEADDLCSLLSKPKDILVSIDKDFQTIPERWFYNLHKDEIKYNTRESADYFWLTQCITGDSTDGYSGLPKSGPKAAAKILEECSWDSVVKAYESKGYTKEFALQQARVARILREGDYREGEIFLWNPLDTNGELMVY